MLPLNVTSADDRGEPPAIVQPPEHWVDPRPVTGDPTGLAFEVTGATSRRAGVMRMLPSLATDPAAATSLRRQLRLVDRFAASGHVVCPLAVLLDRQPARVVMPRIDATPFEQISRWSGQQRLRLAAGLIHWVQTATAAGLMWHGEASGAADWGRHLFLQLGGNSGGGDSGGGDSGGGDSGGNGPVGFHLDYFHRWFEPGGDAGSPHCLAVPSATADCRAVIEVCETLLSPLLDAELEVVGWSAQQRAGLRQVLRLNPEDRLPEDRLSRLAQTLQPWIAGGAIATAIATADSVETQLSPPQATSCLDESCLDESCFDETTGADTAPTQAALEGTIGAGQDRLSMEFGDTQDSSEATGAPTSTSTSTSTSAPTSVSATGGSGWRDDADMPAIGQMLGRFRIDRKIGQGGMGVVYAGTDLSTDEPVAIKVLRAHPTAMDKAVRRFNKEARLLAEVQNNYVTRLFDTGIDGIHHYLAMEFIVGTDLKTWLKPRLPLPQEDALAILADVARALVDAHVRGIIHRDIKPENILMATKSPAVREADGQRNDYHVKLTDFGIARHVDQSASMEMTRAGAIIGTPTYMSPEQCQAGKDVGPTADVYSLGVLLFLMVTGRPPYKAGDTMRLAAMHCFDPVPDPRKINRQIGDPVAALITEMMSKDAAERPANAAVVAQRIDRMIRGESSDIESHPRPPSIDRSKLWERTFEWDLQSSSSELWPHVSNTERLNRAVGLQAVDYETEKGSDGVLRRIASFKLGGLKIAWIEHPFEWIEGQRMGVLREFQSGPMKWFISTVDLIKKPGGGTHLVHKVQIESHGTLGRVVSTIEAGWKGGRALDRVYRRIDQSIVAARRLAAIDPEGDPFETAERLSDVQSRRINQKLDAMLAAGVDVDAAERIADFARVAPPQSLAQVRPLTLAGQIDLPPQHVVDAMLVAASVGLFDLRWDILCPTCRVPAATRLTLDQIDHHTECEACDTSFRTDVAEAIELVFRVHPEVRTVDDAKYCIGGPVHSPHVVSQLRVAAGEPLSINVSLDAGDYSLRTRSMARPMSIRVVDGLAPSQLDLPLTVLADAATATLRSGQCVVQLTNDTETEQLVRLERSIARKNVITAAAATALPRFRELFPEQTFDQHRPVETQNLTFVAVTLDDLDSLYADQSETDAYRQIQHSIELMTGLINDRHGAVVKTNQDGLLATFSQVTDAVTAAEKIHAQACLPMTVGVHRGQALATTQNGRLDYFGRTPRLAVSLSERSIDAVLLSDTVFTDPGVIAGSGNQHGVQQIDDQMVQRRVPVKEARGDDFPSRARS